MIDYTKSRINLVASDIAQACIDIVTAEEQRDILEDNIATLKKRRSFLIGRHEELTLLDAESKKPHKEANDATTETVPECTCKDTRQKSGTKGS